MVGTLHFELYPRPHPYPDASSSAYELWGQMIVTVLNQNHREVLLDIEWNLDTFIEWYLDNQNRLFSDLLEDVRTSESLAQAMNRLWERDFEDEGAQAEWHDKLYEFNNVHSLKSALLGTKIPHILLGTNHNIGEISLELGSEDVANLEQTLPTGKLKIGSWSYTFDVQDFLAHLNQQVQDFLRKGYERAKADTARVRATDLLNRVTST